MSKVVDYYFTPISPWAFLGAGQFRSMTRSLGVEVRVKPVKMGEVFKRTGGLPLAERPEARKAYRLQELERWSKRRRIPLKLQPAHFPTSDLLASRFVLAVEALGGDPLALSQALGRAVWVDERDIADTATLQAIVATAGQDRDAVLAKANDPAIEARLEELTEEAIKRGVFGAPTYVVGDQLFWGQDRLQFLKAALEE